jgi:hydroxyethylthiazole kinase
MAYDNRCSRHHRSPHTRRDRRSSWSASRETPARSSNFVANVLLSVGASPAMVDNPEEAALFAGIADSVLINLGTPTSAQVESMRLAAAAAQKAGKPWVLDPIAAGDLPWRGHVAAELLKFKPAVVRGNASEIIGLAGLGGGARGADSSANPEAAVPAAIDLLAHARAVSASGPVDHVVSRVSGGTVLIKIGGGSASTPGHSDRLRAWRLGCGLYGGSVGSLDGTRFSACSLFGRGGARQGCRV